MSENLAKVLIVEDSPSLLRCYEAYLSNEDCTVLLADNGNEALSLIRTNQPKVVLLDLQLPDMDGLEVINQSKAMKLNCMFIVMTAHGSSSLAVESMRAGALDYLEKPFTRDRLCITIRNALDRQRLVSKYEPGEDDSAQQALDSGRYYGFIGASNEMQSIYRTIESAAMSKATVFITGESGTGKEVCAAAIHQKSNRRNNNFVPLNCAAIPRDLMESEIFGHLKGAFTGAQSSREGAASHADGGTLFLDEIGEMDLDLQSKLLRFIQTGTFQKVGSNKLESVDVRFVCATNRDPLDQVKKGTFREDLYYRLHVIPIALPPLRARQGDVLAIARSFLRQFAEEEQKEFTNFSPDAEEVLVTYPWPGNIRQLQNVVRNIVVLNHGNEVTASMLPPPLDKSLDQLRKVIVPGANNDGQEVASHVSSESLSAVELAQLNSTNTATISGQPRIVYQSELGQPVVYSPIDGLPMTHVSNPAASRKTQRSVSAALSVIQQMLHDKINPPQKEVEHIKELWKVEMEAIEDAIKACDNNIPKAAKYLGVSPSTIYRKRQSWKDEGRL